MATMNWLATEWRQAWRWFQVQLGALIAIAPELYNSVESLQDVIPMNVFRHTMALLGVLVIINSVRKKRA